MGLGSLGLIASASAYAHILIPKRKEKIGVALVGLGYYSKDLLAPALQLTEHCELKGIVTGSPEKIPVWKRRYGIEDKNVYNYDNLSQVANNPDIDIIYIVLPTGLHAKYTVIAANASITISNPHIKTYGEFTIIISHTRKGAKTIFSTGHGGIVGDCHHYSII